MTRSERRRLLGAAAGCTALAGLAATQRAAAAQALPAPPSGAEPVATERAAERAPALPAIGTRLALVAVPMLDGSRFEPADADGRVLIVYWWASWCPFCALQSPEIDRLWRANRARGLQVLALSIDRHPDEARAHLARKGHAFPSGWVDATVARRMPKPKGLPVTLVRGRDGTVLQAEQGQMFPEDVEALARWLG